jgi:hypothetical protein
MDGTLMPSGLALSLQDVLQQEHQPHRSILSAQIPEDKDRATINGKEDVKGHVVRFFAY